MLYKKRIYDFIYNTVLNNYLPINRVRDLQNQCSNSSLILLTPYIIQATNCTVRTIEVESSTIEVDSYIKYRNYLTKAKCCY